MAVKIRLKRIGAKKKPFYRVVVADARYPRDGRFIEQIGTYDPMTDPARIVIDGSRALYWMKNGAQPTDTVRALLKKSGALEKAAEDARIAALQAAAAPQAVEAQAVDSQAVEAQAVEAAEMGAGLLAAAEETAADAIYNAAAAEGEPAAAAAGVDAVQAAAVGDDAADAGEVATDAGGGAVGEVAVGDTATDGGEIAEADDAGREGAQVGAGAQTAPGDPL